MFRFLSKDESKDESVVVEPSKEPEVVSEALPVPNVVPFPTEFVATLKDAESRSLEPESPVLYKGTWYAGVLKAAAFLGINADVIRDYLEKAEPHKDLYDPNGHYNAAVVHRVLPLGDSSSSLIVSDYKIAPDSKMKVSRGYVKRDRKRIPIDLEVPTGPDGDGQLLTQAHAC